MIVLATHLFRPVRYLVYLSPFYWFRRKSISRGERIRRALEDLGPIFVKFGQVLSTRRDLLPPDIADELAKLQDQVPPFPGAQARARVEEVCGQPIATLFKEFDETPLASASIAQVHAARLHDGRDVVVKVLRPGVERQIRADLDVLHLIAGLAEDYWRDGRRLLPPGSGGRVQRTVLDELDLIREAANAAQLKRNFEGSTLLYVPEVYWPLTRREVMVMGAHPRRAHPRPPLRCAHVAPDFQVLAGERRADLLHPGVQTQLLPRRHASRQHLRGRGGSESRRATWRWIS